MKYAYAKYASLCAFVLSFWCSPFAAQAAVVHTDQADLFFGSNMSAETVTLNPSGDHVYVVAAIDIDAGGDHVVGVDACGTTMTRLARSSASASGAYLYVYGVPLSSTGTCDITVNFDTEGLQGYVHASSFSGAQATADVEGIGEVHDNTTSTWSLVANATSNNTVLFAISRAELGGEMNQVGTDVLSASQAGFTTWLSSTPFDTSGAHDLGMYAADIQGFDALGVVIAEFSG